MKLQKDLREFVEFLNSRKVEYLIVGGYGGKANAALLKGAA
jgi:hypothetical protein